MHVKQVLVSGGDDPPSWTDKYWQPPNQAYWDSRDHSWIAVDKHTRQQQPLPDQQTAQHAVLTMRYIT